VIFACTIKYDEVGQCKDADAEARENRVGRSNCGSPRVLLMSEGAPVDLPEMTTNLRTKETLRQSSNDWQRPIAKSFQQFELIAWVYSFKRSHDLGDFHTF
jgi:hypothetical protein